MDEELDYVGILKSIIGEAENNELLLEVSKQNKEKVELYDFYEVFKNYCLIILMVGTSKRIDMEKFKVKLEDETIILNGFEFTKQYEKFIRLVENKRFEILKTIV